MVGHPVINSHTLSVTSHESWVTHQSSITSHQSPVTSHQSWVISHQSVVSRYRTSHQLQASSSAIVLETKSISARAAFHAQPVKCKSENVMSGSIDGVESEKIGVRHDRRGNVVRRPTAWKITIFSWNFSYFSFSEIFM
jgi:hypothetical protein